MNNEQRTVNKKSKGFTLIELLIAIAVFAMTMTGVVMVFIRAIEGQRKTASLQEVQENGRFIMEMMAKEIRMSTINSSGGENQTLDITAHKATGDESAVYALSGGQILRNGQAITSGKIQVNQLKFYINKGSGAQDMATVVLTLEDKEQKIEEQAKINLETTISSRAY